MNSKREGTTVADALENARELLSQHPAAAAQQSRNVISVEPGIAEAYIILGCALRALGDEAGAAEAEQQGLAIARNDSVIRKANEQISAGKLREADTLLNLYLADTPNDPVAVYLRSVIQQRFGDPDGACALLERATTLAPNYPEAREALQGLRASAQPSDAEPEQWFTADFTGKPESAGR